MYIHIWLQHENKTIHNTANTPVTIRHHLCGGEGTTRLHLCISCKFLFLSGSAAQTRRYAGGDNRVRHCAVHCPRFKVKVATVILTPAPREAELTEISAAG